MALTAFCPTCERTVYIEEDKTPICPVCSTPLLEETTAGTPPEENTPAEERAG